ncbi:MAG: NAD(P)(+) transhydrogenase (Re/Si-specific) subunit beta [Alphaproteobacteria bacterium]|nr:NAD(P)(+) transhydrogenase (Re/Si-specific) subunit beta [Alphaproteobacteria bacterium]
MSGFISFINIITGIMFILAIRGLSSPQTARQGNLIGIFGMIIAIITTLFSQQVNDKVYPLIITLFGGGVGIYIALKTKMTSLPQTIAIFNGLGGLSAVFIALASIISGSTSYLDNSIGIIIGGIAFSGSMIAFAKLQGIISSQITKFNHQHLLNLILTFCILSLLFIFIISHNPIIFYILGISTIILGILLVLPIGGADMPVIISILNSYSGWAAVGIGFSLNNVLLIIVGSIVGASGSILSYIMVKSMNRSLLNVITGGLSDFDRLQSNEAETKIAKPANARDAAFIMENANKIIIVPGYGMAVAQAQYVLKEMAEILQNKYHVEVKYAIHPVAGRMPGHMNVLLAEANVPYEDVFTLDDINREFITTDVAYVIGANDITNPLAKTDISSPIYGMPVLDVEKSKTIFFVKRSLANGYSGIENPLFFAENTLMLYGDAKQITEQIVTNLEND